MSTQNNRVFIDFLNRGMPLRFYWQGWEASSHSLLRNGWEFSADEWKDQYLDAHVVHLAATCPEKKYCLATRFHMSYPNFYQATHTQMFQDQLSDITHRPLSMGMYTAKDTVRTVHAHDFETWHRLRPVDILNPNPIELSDFRFRDLKIFNPIPKVEEKAIYIPEQSVDDLFNMILKVQYPQQQEIKKKLSSVEEKPTFQAQVFSLVV